MEYYELLGINKTATAQEIKKAYRQMAKKYHPDKNPDNKEAEAKFKEINEAYQVLSDESKRNMYDRFGKDGVNGQAGGSGGFNGGFSGFGADIFDEIFGGGRGRSSKKRESQKYNLDMAIELHISFKEAVFGVKKNIEFNYKKSCSKCFGTGAKNGKMENCRDCNGAGEIHIQQGFMTFAQTCPTCQGNGQRVIQKCSKCNGAGYDVIKEKVDISIPEGIDNGNRMRVTGKGNIAKNGTRGDLYVNIIVEDDETFIRDESDIYIKVPVFFTQVILGDTIKIPSLNGKLDLKIPQGAKDKEQFVFKNEGIKDVHSYRKGNLIAQINIEYPKNITDEQRELLEKLNDSFGIDSKPHETFFQKLKNWF